MKVKRITLHNVMNVRDVDFNLEGEHLYLVGGKNNQGKSSALRGFVMALCGKRGCDYPDVPLRNGENEGSIRVEIEGNDELHSDNLVIMREFERHPRGGVKEKLRILDSEGDESPEPQTLLNRLYKSKGFDPLDFERMAPKMKAAVFRDMLGLNFEESDKKINRLMEERKREKKELDEVKALLDNTSRFSDVPSEEVSVSDPMEEFKRREKVNQDNNEVRSIVEDCKYQAGRCTSKIESLKAQLKSAEEEEKKAKEALKEIEAKAASLVDLNCGEIRQQIADSEDVNRKVRDNKKWDALSAAKSEKVAAVNLLTNQIEDERNEQKSKLENADWPVDGLGLDSSGVLYNGLPFEQAAKSIRIRTSVRMGMALNPDLRVLVCQDGNDLDTESLEELQGFLEENDFQMLLEVVTRNEEDEARCSVVLEDGAIKEPVLK